MTEIDRLRFGAQRGRKWSSALSFGFGINYEHLPMGTTLDKSGRRRPWTIHRITVFLLWWRFHATLTVWTD